MNGFSASVRIIFLPLAYLLLCLVLHGCASDDASKMQDSLALKGWTKEKLADNIDVVGRPSDVVPSGAASGSIVEQSKPAQPVSLAPPTQVSSGIVIDAAPSPGKTDADVAMVNKWGVDLTNLKGAKYIRASELVNAEPGAENPAHGGSSTKPKQEVAATKKDAGPTKDNKKEVSATKKQPANEGDITKADASTSGQKKSGTANNGLLGMLKHGVTTHSRHSGRRPEAAKPSSDNAYGSNIISDQPVVVRHYDSELDLYGTQASHSLATEEELPSIVPAPLRRPVVMRGDAYANSKPLVHGAYTNNARVRHKKAMLSRGATESPPVMVARNKKYRTTKKEVSVTEKKPADDAVRQYSGRNIRAPKPSSSDVRGNNIMAAQSLHGPAMELPSIVPAPLRRPVVMRGDAYVNGKSLVYGAHVNNAGLLKYKNKKAMLGRGPADESTAIMVARDSKSSKRGRKLEKYNYNGGKAIGGPHGNIAMSAKSSDAQHYANRRNSVYVQDLDQNDAQASCAVAPSSFVPAPLRRPVVMRDGVGTHVKPLAHDKSVAVGKNTMTPSEKAAQDSGLVANAKVLRHSS